MGPFHGMRRVRKTSFFFCGVLFGEYLFKNAKNCVEKTGPACAEKIFTPQKERQKRQKSKARTGEKKHRTLKFISKARARRGKTPRGRPHVGAGHLVEWRRLRYNTSIFRLRAEDVIVIKFKKVLKKYLFTLITLGISMTILLIFLFSGNSVSQLQQIFSGLDPFWMLLAGVMVVGGWLMEGWCDYLLCRHVSPNWKFGPSFTIAMTGLFYSAVTPFSTGGQPMQIYSMSKMGMKPGSAGAVISVKTITYQIIMVLYGLVLMILQLPFFQANVSNLSFLTVFGLLANSIFIAAVILVSVNPRFLYGLLQKLYGFLHRIRLVKNPDSLYQKTTTQLDTFHDGFCTMGKDVGLYVKVCVLTVFQITMTNSTTYCIYRAFHLSEASFWVIMAAQVFATMIAAFVPLPGASGGAEGTFLAFCRMFFGGMLTPAMLVWRLMTYYSNILFGAIFTFVGSKRYVLDRAAPETEQKAA